ncbi:MAG: S-adenosylmethionine synthetase [Candidatus Syntrophoarchaeum caldarius]|uniref:S-adenosylmethionine synthase n=1 Tax=Candidatus Syntropharchaeum caldarium TaxID=1838285 RepID=A0A1F2P7A2_9EURY|nr:MAG: S-adenosylmethionine synthetase [Candidatus Syntrophoarchaeum caldarius]
MRNIQVEAIHQLPIELQEIELVERKGIGHPDSICDGIAEAVSRALCNEYKKRYGMILHHNTDEVAIVAGRSRPAFGGGEIITPSYILLNGRATKWAGDEEVPVDVIALRAAKSYLQESIHNLNPETDVVIDCKIGEGSYDLVEIFDSRDRVPLANDTSFGVGHAPFSEVENIVYNIEREMVNNLSKREKAVGEDIKVMGLRVKDKITVTIADAFVSRYVDDIDHYVAIRDEIATFAKDVASSYTDREIEVFVNVGDDIENGSIYLTVTGLSAEMGDDGSVGRGNRANGLITPNRSMSLEATSGKNPVNHVGKIYNLLTTQIANEAIEKIADLQEISVRILSQIGQPIDNPLVANAQIIPKNGVSVDDIAPAITRIIDDWLERVTEITELVSEGKITTF